MMNNDYSDLPTSRGEALRTGAKRYFTGKPCKHGHISPRGSLGHCLECGLHASRNLSEAAAAKRAVLMKKWRERNPDYHREYNYRPENNWRLFLANYKWRYKGFIDHWTEEDFEVLRTLWIERNTLSDKTGQKHRLIVPGGLSGLSYFDVDDLIISTSSR
jgi:hypothetical protein